VSRYHFEVEGLDGAFRRLSGLGFTEDPAMAEPYRLAVETALHRRVRLVEDEYGPRRHPELVLAAQDWRSTE
jgi:hypothetical protein